MTKQDDKIKQEVLKEIWKNKDNFLLHNKGYECSIHGDTNDNECFQCNKKKLEEAIDLAISKTIEKMNKQGEGVVSISPKLDVRIHAKPIVEIEKRARHLALKEVREWLIAYQFSFKWAVLDDFVKHFGVEKEAGK